MCELRSGRGFGFSRDRRKGDEVGSVFFPCTAKPREGEPFEACFWLWTAALGESLLGQLVFALYFIGSRTVWRAFAFVGSLALNPL